MIKNTFAPDCENEYFHEEEILLLCRHGFPYEKFPPEVKAIADKMVRIHSERCKDVDGQLDRIRLRMTELDAKEARGESTLLVPNWEDA
ncbi:MAG: hypothetical protein MPK62_00515 [Alphaproteobacteria bacterium]|nr:hypothetical protein [Alphaproteobacteria bacterium]